MNGIKKTKSNLKPRVLFEKKLILNQWLLSLFQVDSFMELANCLLDENLEGLDENNTHHFHNVLSANYFNLEQLPIDLLMQYDQNIVKHTRSLNEQRIRQGEKPIVWKYFQYLALLFSEIYLDQYFRNHNALLDELNKQIHSYNLDKRDPDRIKPFENTTDAWQQLNKLAFWMATGSGKTLLMHVNLLQYLDYLTKYHRQHELNGIILLTPNEGLSEQHLSEFKLSGIYAEIFKKSGPSLYSTRTVQILEVTKLGDEMGDKTVAVDALESNNLVLIDEGHRGASAGSQGVWMRFRNSLCEKGFSFEYSATFGQAIRADSKLTELYAKGILFNYSYPYFYKDGFGKDYKILNLQQETQQHYLELYLVASLLSFFQQQRLYRKNACFSQQFNIEKPLWVFVGGRVVKTLSKYDASDIVKILQFLSRYVEKPADSIQRIEQLLTSGLITANHRNLFAKHFTYLNFEGISPQAIYKESLELLFNSPFGGKLYIENLKNVPGEIALRLGDGNDAFGVINVGDDSKLMKICSENGFATGDYEFSDSLFHNINQSNSNVNLLIGSKKFTEGWNSWRVSTMGLMNMGKKEGAQIIQLFGRGVRLKGYDSSLKRSNMTHLPEGVKRPNFINSLETLGIFGVDADYMAQFRNFLEQENMPTNNDLEEIFLPVIKNHTNSNLKTIRLKKRIEGNNTGNDPFRRLGPIPTIAPPDVTNDHSTVYLQKNQVVLNWYPKVQGMASSALANDDTDVAWNETHLTSLHLAFLNYDRIYFELERYKTERGWHNLNLSKQGIEALLAETSWYCLLAPKELLIGNSFEKVHIWEEITIALLKKYIKHYYTFRKREWEAPHLEYQALDGNDKNFLCTDESPNEGYYRISIDKSEIELIAKIQELKTSIENNEYVQWEFQGLKAIWCSNHLYRPLLSQDTKIVDISPVPLNKGERQFVEDLMIFCRNNSEFIKSFELYLLRNLSKGRGVGFFEAGNFHPDFILWIVDGDRQRIVFVDPKGIRHLGFDDPKIKFYETINEIEQRLGDSRISLDSFIVSNTPSHTMRELWGVEKEEMQNRHILFLEEDRESYVEKICEF